MDPLAIVGSYQRITQRRAIFEQEHSIGVTPFRLIEAGRRISIPEEHLAIKSLPGCDGLYCCESRFPGCGREDSLQLGTRNGRRDER
jgi:hypothetical protein